MSMNRAEIHLDDLCASSVTLVKTAVNMSSWLCMSMAPGISSCALSSDWLSSKTSICVDSRSSAVCLGEGGREGARGING